MVVIIILDKDNQKKGGKPYLGGSLIWGKALFGDTGHDCCFTYIIILNCKYFLNKIGAKKKCM